MGFLRRLFRLTALFLFRTQLLSLPLSPSCPCVSARTWFARVGVRMEMGAVSLTLSVSCIRLQLNKSLTWPTLSRVGRCQTDQVRLQGCLWWGPAPRHTCPSPMSMCASSSTSSLMLVRSRSRLLVASGSRLVSLCLSCCSGVGRAGGLASPCPFLGAVYVVGLLATVGGFWGRQGWGLGIPLPFLGCRIRRGSPHDCAWLPGFSGPGAWHPLAPTWVPRRGCSPRRCVCGFPLSLSGVSLFRVVLVAVRFWTSLPCVAIGQLFICAFLVLTHASQQFPVSRIFVELSLSRVLRQLQLSPCLWLFMSVVRPLV